MVECLIRLNGELFVGTVEAIGGDSRRLIVRGPDFVLGETFMRALVIVDPVEMESDSDGIWIGGRNAYDGDILDALIAV